MSCPKPGGKTFSINYCKKIFLIQKKLYFYNKTTQFETPVKKSGTRNTIPAEDRTISCFLVKLSSKFGRIYNLRDIHKDNKKAFTGVRKKMIKNDLSFWNRVFWSDESKFNLLQSDTKTYVRRDPNKALDPRCAGKTRQHGAVLCVGWGAFSWCSVGPIVRIEEIMKKEL